jgi:hypothetical protein
MSKTLDKKLISLAIATVLTVAVAYFVVKEKSSETYELAETIFLQKLQGKTSDVASLVFVYQDKKNTIRKINGNWQIVDKHNYIVEEDIIGGMIVNAEQFRIIEKKTDNPARFEPLGLNSPEAKEQVSTRIIMSNIDDSQVYADFIRGKQRGFGKLEKNQAFYVRNTDENQGWLVDGKFPIEINADIFLNKSEYKIDKNRIMRVSYNNPKDVNYEISRMMPSADFEISTPAKEAHSRQTLNEMGWILAEELKFEDVKPASLEVKNNILNEINFKTYDGLEFIIKIVENTEQGVWVVISANGDKDSAKKEAERINLVANGWVYKVSDRSAEILTKKLVDIEFKEKKKEK